MSTITLATHPKVKICLQKSSKRISIGFMKTSLCELVILFLPPRDLVTYDVLSELAKYGNLQEMIVCDNVGDHLLGNVYARFEYEAEAARAVQALNDRWYAMRPLHAELSPVTDFRESCCRQNELGECKREG